MGQGTARNRTIDVAKGLAIVLMVAGHYLPADSPAWWVTLHDLIYTFHMPVFFFAAGYLWSMRPNEGYGEYLRRKVHRLLAPYVAIVGFYLGIKLLAGLVIDLEHPARPLDAVLAFTDPAHSFTPFLWFLGVLFAVYAAFPPIARLGPPAIAASGVLSLAVYLLREGCYVPAVSHGYCFFTAGYAARRWFALDRPASGWMDLAGLPMLCAFLATAALWPRSTELRRAAVGSLGLAAVYLLARAAVCRGLPGVPVLSRLGRSCMTIYLFHTLFEGAAETVIYRVPALEGLPFAVQAGAAVAAGVVLPIVWEELALNRSAIAGAILLGRPWPTDVAAGFAPRPSLPAAHARASREGSVGNTSL